ncbi:acetate--CoA ligase family protein [Desulfatiglans anilini]|uniref:acetate--CoA ligase family protein n=1 Tax=Desulfatiglans anilini TaxID=90728 RepID=UPI00041CA6AA|nr:CoA-binding protein [Desulfatiglans anilini]
MSATSPTYDLDPLFRPRTVAVIGASDNPGKLGYHVMKSLIEGGFEGEILPVNAKAERVMGLAAYPSVEACPSRIDLGIVVVPAAAVPTVLEQCIRKKVGGLVLISAGFKEIEDPAGARQQEALKAMAVVNGIPVIGPNTFGMINLHHRLNASFTPEFSLAGKGGIALVSQSGGMSHLLAFLAMNAGIGFSKIIGLGNRLNLDFAEILPYLASDPDTRVIALYIEGLDEPRPLLEAAESVRGKKPVLVYKTGAASTGDQASMSHTGSLAGRHEIYSGAFHQAGMLTVDGSEAMLDLGKALNVCSLPRGGRIAILTGQAGPGMAAADACEALGLEIARFGSATQSEVDRLLPPLAMRTNPVDMGPAWYDSGAIQGIMRAVLEDEGVDGIILLMMYASANREVVPVLSGLLNEWRQRKPLVSCLVSPAGIWDEAVRELEEGRALANYPTPERAAEAMAGLCRYACLSNTEWRAL